MRCHFQHVHSGRPIRPGPIRPVCRWLTSVAGTVDKVETVIVGGGREDWRGSRGDECGEPEKPVWTR